jgi:mono/diheme cytochrome c family protein
MTDESTGGGELAPRPPEDVEPASSALTPAPSGEQRGVERFSAGPRTHAVELTEERSAQIVRQSASARSLVFLAFLLIAIFIPVYWFYENGIPALGTDGRLTKEADVQYVTDVSRGYELYIANCARCHGEDGQGGIGPPLNDQAKLYNSLTADGQPGTGHLNPNYIDNVLTVGGRYVCGDPNSLMAAWLEPNGPLNYRQVEELIAWLTASNEIVFEYDPAAHGVVEAEAPASPMAVAGWRDPNWQPAPGATPPPACWRNPSGVIGGSAPAAPAPAASPGAGGSPGPAPGASAPPVEGGTADAPRVIALQATADLRFKDPAGNVVTQIEVSAGETIQFEIDNTAGFEHNFWIGSPDQLAAPNATTDAGIPAWTSGVQTLTWTAGGDGLQFACTVPGHYSTMNGSIVVQG